MAVEWIKTNNYYNREIITCDVWSKKIGMNKTIYVMDSKEENFRYTFSCGANSENSFSGSMYGLNINNLQEAMNFIDELIPLWFSSNHKKIRELKERYS